MMKNEKIKRNIYRTEKKKIKRIRIERIEGKYTRNERMKETEGKE